MQHCRKRQKTELKEGSLTGHSWQNNQYAFGCWWHSTGFVLGHQEWVLQDSRSDPWWDGLWLVRRFCQLKRKQLNNLYFKTSNLNRSHRRSIHHVQPRKTAYTRMWTWSQTIKVWMPCGLTPQVYGMTNCGIFWNIFVFILKFYNTRVGKCTTISAIEAIKQLYFFGKIWKTPNHKTGMAKRLCIPQMPTCPPGKNTPDHLIWLWMYVVTVRVNSPG